MGLWTQALFTGIALGTIYGVVGVGFVIIHRITGMVNFAQGELAMVGAFGAVVASHGLPSWLAMVCGGLFGAAAGLLLYLLAIHPLRNVGTLVQTIASLGAAIVLRSVAQLLFGTKPYSLDPLIDGGPVRVLGGAFSYQAVALVVIALALLVVLKIFFDRTMIGRALSACAVNRYAAGVVGINVVTMAIIAFTISGAVTGMIGALQVPMNFATAGIGLSLSLKGFIAAILGGFDRLGLTLVGGLLVGVLEAVSAAAISSSYQDVIVLSTLLALLVIRPSGLTRMKVSDRV